MNVVDFSGLTSVDTNLTTSTVLKPGDSFVVNGLTYLVVHARVNSDAQDEIKVVRI